MDPGERLCDDRADPECLGRQSGVLAGAALAVVLAGDNEPTAVRARPGGKGRVEPAEGELGDRVHVRAQRHDDRAVGREVAGGDVVTELDEHLAAQQVLERRLPRRGLDVRTLHHADLRGLLGRRRHEDVRVVHPRVHLRDAEGRLVPEVARIGDHAPQRGGRGRRGAAEVDLVVVGPAPAGKVPVEGADRDPAGRGRLTHPDTWPAGGLEHPRARRDERLIRAAAGERIEDLLAAGRDGHEDLGVDGLSLEHRGDDREILVARVHRGADAHLLDLRAANLADRDDIPGTRWLGDERLELVQVDDLALVVLRVTVGGKVDEVCRPLLLGEPFLGARIAREEAGCRAELGDHVADRAPLRDRQGLHTRTGELEDPADAARHVPTAEKLEDDVLRLDPRAERAVELDLDDLRHRENERVAGQGDRDIEATGADREHRDRSGHDRVAVRAQEHLAWLGEALHVQVVADAGARTGEVDAVLLSEAPEE